jgi:menaquinone-dependent protoporphyrinogen oxidase
MAMRVHSDTHEDPAMTSRVLIVYGTTDGQTGKIAAAMGDTMRARGAHVDVVDAASGAVPGAGGYAGVIVAASLHAGGYQKAVGRWVAANAVALASLPTAFVSVCLGVLERNPATDAHLQRLIDEFFAATHWSPPTRKLVAGALLYTQYNWITRRLMKRIVAKAHGDTDTTRDFEYTDWADVRAFATDFLARLDARPLQRAAG